MVVPSTRKCISRYCTSTCYVLHHVDWYVVFWCNESFKEMRNENNEQRKQEDEREKYKENERYKMVSRNRKGKKFKKIGKKGKE